MHQFLVQEMTSLLAGAPGRGLGLSLGGLDLPGGRQELGGRSVHKKSPKSIGQVSVQPRGSMFFPTPTHPPCDPHPAGHAFCL